MTRFIVLALALTACSKKHDTEKLAGLCTHATEVLARDASTASADDFQSLLSSTLQACSQACDGDDEPSCHRLDKHLTKICKVMGDVCDTLCDTAQSPSLKAGACKLAKKK
jgi:hypothetical protein